MHDHASTGVRAQLKAALRHLVAACAAGSTTGAQRVTQLTGAQPGTVSRWTSPDRDDCMPLDVALMLTVETGATSIAAVFAAACGCRLVPIAEGEGAVERAALIDELLAKQRHHATTTAEMAAALADGQVTTQECRTILAAMEREAEQQAAMRRLIAAGAGGR